MVLRWLAALAVFTLLAACGDSTPTSGSEATPAASTELSATATAAPVERPEVKPFTVEMTYHTLENGLKVILSHDDTAPVVTVAVYYNIGFRIEPRDRTGFAHLFEHMMFQGSENLGKMEFVNLVSSNGGILNGSTRFDYTNYFEIVITFATYSGALPLPSIFKTLIPASPTWSKKSIVHKSFGDIMYSLSNSISKPVS